ncbi:PREDICTED: uncharacterized protein LOC108764785 isoform X2 [Trachymyrmex cornetzi]|uniref:Uncharacterized protein n=1 Tax=Trachymyrmex cornetzi TaxID=471704 RepID=A0A151J1C9_9HYME|nr:PREDICTED: uncharacterized protein LOC108764785 isoform X2 [Trachymyrmex cornetzi]KYN15685.1 hypothetical protein ALC57_12087 [Trachymyrmex cornetzi]
MSLTSRTNRWASRVIIILQLVTWNAVGIILLHRGVSTLHKRILETSNVVEVDPPTGLESVVSSTRHEYDLSTQQQPINKNVEIIQIDPSLGDDTNLSGLIAIRNERLKNASEIFSEKQPSTFFLADPLAVPTTENKDVMNKISRIARDREHILGNRISNNIHAEEDVTSTSDYSESKIAGSVLRKEEDLDVVENATRATVHETSSTLGKEADQDQFTIRTGKSNVKFSRVNENIATTAVALVSIGAIMLLVGPIVIVMRILDERRQARKLMALPSRSREDLPPTYEQAVLMDEAPRYSTLALNYDRTPPPSPTFSSTYTFSNSAT